MFPTDVVIVDGGADAYGAVHGAFWMFRRLRWRPPVLRKEAIRGAGVDPGRV